MRVPKRAVLLQELRACGKLQCRTCGGRVPRHGPYWYAHWWDRGERKMRSAYLGKRLDDKQQAQLRRQPRLPDPFKVLGVNAGVDEDALRRAYKQRAREAHPDVGGSHQAMVEVNIAYAQARALIARRRSM